MHLYTHNYLCIYIYIYIYMYDICTHTHIHTQIHTFINKKNIYIGCVGLGFGLKGRFSQWAVPHDNPTLL